MSKEVSLGSLIDKLYVSRQLRIDLDHKVDAMKQEERDIAGQITNLLNTAGLEKASGSVATASLGDKVAHHATDWDAVRRWMIDQIPEKELEVACLEFAKAVAGKRRAKALTALRDFLAKHVAWETLEKRIRSTVAEERFETGEPIPGTSRFVERTVTSLVKR